MTQAAFPRPQAAAVRDRDVALAPSLAWSPSSAFLLTLWMIAGCLLFVQLGNTGVGRSQEARVLETAREMVDAPLESWLIPQVNGHLRMQKPPFAYWVTAWTYQLFNNTTQGIGRIPAALSAWLTLGLTGAAAMRLFGRRAAFFAGSALLGGFLFFRHGRLAETDVMVMLFVTAGCWSMWRAMRARTILNTVLWFHAAAAAIGISAMVKGPPAMYPMLFLLVQCVIERRWRILLIFILSGALLTFAVIACPWFIYVWRESTSGALVKDLRNSAEGGKGHWDLPHVYIYQLAVGVAPWTGVCFAALILAFRRARRNADIRGLLVWFAVILVPLCLWGNKQRHYLLPLLPPLMILTGWYVDRILRMTRHSPSKQPGKVLRVIVVITIVGCAIAAVAVPVVGWASRGQIWVIDWVMMLVAGAGAVASILMLRRRRLAGGVSLFAAANCVVMYVALVLWSPTLDPVTPQGIAQGIRERYGNAPLVFVHREHLPLVYHLNQIIPVARTEAELKEVLKAQPNSIAIAVRTDNDGQAENRVRQEMFYDDGDGNYFMIGPVQIPSR